MGGMGAAGAFGQPQAQAQGQQGQGKINFQDPFSSNILSKKWSDYSTQQYCHVKVS